MYVCVCVCVCVRVCACVIVCAGFTATRQGIWGLRVRVRKRDRE